MFLKFLSSECPVLSILLIVNYPSLQFSFESFFFVSVKVVFSFKDILVCSILRRIFPRCPRQFPIFESQTVNTFSQASLSHFSFRPKIKKRTFIRNHQITFSPPPPFSSLTHLPMIWKKLS